MLLFSRECLFVYDTNEESCNADIVLIRLQAFCIIIPGDCRRSSGDVDFHECPLSVGRRRYVTHLYRIIIILSV